MKRCSESLNLSPHPGNTHKWTSPEAPSRKNLLSQPTVPSSLSFLPPHPDLFFISFSHLSILPEGRPVKDWFICLRTVLF